MKRVGIIGGGASGLMAAVAAAKEGARVTILEKQDRIGKKILATGNGKCNLSNLSFSAKRDYNSRNPEKLKSYFDKFSVQDTFRFFENHGLVLTEKNGYLYPRSGQASAVLNLFLELLEYLHIQVITECKVNAVTQKRNGEFVIETNLGKYVFDSIILSCGSPAGTKEKEQLGGIELAKMFALKSCKMLPALTALRCGGDFWKALAGVRCEGEITLKIIEKNGKYRTFSERGELQLTDYGLSGIPVFQLSRHAASALDEHMKVEASVDFFPDIPLNEWKKYCEERCESHKGRLIAAFLEGMVNKKIAQVLMKEAGIKNTEKVAFPMSKEFWKMMCLMRNFGVSVKATNPAANSQVCMGGVLLTEVDDKLQTYAISNMFITGELLDVDGRCGGYNLQWAWTSGWIAGKAAAQ